MAVGLPPKKVVVVGAGPVGCLTAIMLAKRGWNVEVYESRPGMVCHGGLSILLSPPLFRHETSRVQGQVTAAVN
jgi:2-polyprenyl-6-methoxyphenol hydroxylase-like FAD-dependent oxidoreductase